MAEEQTPEMLRLSLQDLALRVKICNLGNIEHTLSEALDPPSSRNVRRAIDSLIDVKALTGLEDLTPLGSQLAKLPLDVFLGKLILLGSIFQCLDGALTIAAILTSKSPFSAPFGSRSQAELARVAFKRSESGPGSAQFNSTLAKSIKVILTFLPFTMHTAPGAMYASVKVCRNSSFAGKIA